MIKKQNKPKKEKRSALEPSEVDKVILLWGQGRSVSEIHMDEHLEPAFVKVVHDKCDAVQEYMTQIMQGTATKVIDEEEVTIEVPNNENKMKIEVAEQFDDADLIVETIIKYSDINNNGDWHMYKEFDWSTE